MWNDADLRRKIAHTPNLELASMQNEISRLKKDLKEAYKHNRDLHVARPQMNPKGMQYIKGAFNMANDLNVVKRKLEKQNKFQKEVTEAYQKIINADYRGNIYLTEGTKLARKHFITERLQGSQEIFDPETRVERTDKRIPAKIPND